MLYRSINHLHHCHPFDTTLSLCALHSLILHIHTQTHTYIDARTANDSCSTLDDARCVLGDGSIHLLPISPAKRTISHLLRVHSVGNDNDVNCSCSCKEESDQWFVRTSKKIGFTAKRTWDNDFRLLVYLFIFLWKRCHRLIHDGLKLESKNGCFNLVQLLLLHCMP